MKRLLLLLLTFFILAKILVFSPGCANIIPPAGGPRDSLPPVITGMNPKDSTKDFTDNRITIAFDEYIDIQDVQKNLLVSPIPKLAPIVERKLSSIIVKLKDTLQPNTTYTLNFGDAIRDLNEANILKNFTYIFTTGSYFDSLTLRGRVILAKDGGTDTTLTVMLHKNREDSAIVKEKPRYVAKLDRNGYFTFRNLPADTFAIYAIGDESGTYRFSGRDQVFGFADKPVKSGDTSFITLYAFPDNEGASGAPPPRGSQATSKEKRLIVANNLSGTQDLLKNFEMSFEVPLRTFDTTKIVFATDSTFTPVTNYSLQLDSTRKKAILRHAWKENTAYHVILDKDFAADTLGRKLLKSDTITFATKGLSEYGSVRLRFRNLDMKKNPVVLFIDGTNIIDSAVLTSPDYYKQLFQPGEYTLRILYDDNKNGTWDPGEFFKNRKQPELVKPVAQPINIKANWDNEFERDVNALPVPPRNGQRQNDPGQQRRNNNSGLRND